MRNRFLDERTARDIDTSIAKILRGLGRPEAPLVLDDVRALQKLDRHYYSSVDEGPVARVRQLSVHQDQASFLQSYPDLLLLM
jgi:hypothetical protein